MAGGAWLALPGRRQRSIKQARQALRPAQQRTNRAAGDRMRSRLACFFLRTVRTVRTDCFDWTAAHGLGGLCTMRERGVFVLTWPARLRTVRTTRFAQVRGRAALPCSGVWCKAKPTNCRAKELSPAPPKRGPPRAHATRQVKYGLDQHAVKHPMQISPERFHSSSLGSCPCPAVCA